MITLIYDSNNSGGSWWLSDANWRALEAAGWTVHWCQLDTRHGGWSSGRNYDDPLVKAEYHGVDARWLGALACSAAKQFDTPEAGIAEWERLTSQCASDEGCNCCGPPHSFEYVNENGQKHYSSVYVTETEMAWS